MVCISCTVGGITDEQNDFHWGGADKPNARKVKSAYIGINGVARKIKKGYIGDSSNKARLFFSNGFIWERYNVITNYIYNKYNITTSKVGTVNHTLRSGSMQITWNDPPDAFHRSEPRWDSNRWDTDIGSGEWNGVDPGDMISLTWNSSGSNTIYVASKKVEREWVNGELISTFYYSDIINCTVSNVSECGSYIGQVTETSKKYPDNGDYNGYWYIYQNNEQIKGDFIDIVEMESSSAYPDNGISGNYWYVKITS